jgi:hypothetical protein
MLKRIFIVSIAVLTASVVMAQAFRWIDSDGTVHYSDRPTEGAEQIYLPESNRGTRPYARPAALAATADDTAGPSGPFSYDSIEVSAPGPEETLWNIAGVLNVTLNVQPSLQAGHRVRVYFDGEASLVSGSSFQIQEVHRGVHNIQAEVLDENGQLLGRSQPNCFYVQQNSIAN